jgi:capsular polysaccharide biosynthesis protein
MTPSVFPGQAPSRNKTPMAAAVPVFITVFLITVIIATAITFILPESFASTARIKVDQSLASTNNAYDPYFTQTEFEVIQSQVVLEPVIANLNLNVEWGKKYYNGETLKTTEALEILKGRLSLATVRGTKLLTITVYSDNPREAAQIANAIAEAYQQYSIGKNYPLGAVQIIDRAEPGRFSVKPNKPMNIALGAAAGIILGALAALVAGLFASRKK